MRRREFIIFVGGTAVACSLAARAQQVSRVRHVCVLMGLAASDPGGQAQARAFKHGLQELGWTEGQNLRIEYRWTAGDIALTQTLAKELVDLAPDVLLATNTPTLETLQQATRTIPIVFVGVGEPVGQGFVKSLAHPGGNLTGFMLLEFSLATKWLALLKELVPGLTRVAIMFNPETAPFSGNFLREIEAVASSFAVEPAAAPVHDDVEIARALASLGREPRGGLIALPEVFLVVHRESIAALAAKYRVPAVYPLGVFAASGGLMSYGIDAVDQYRRAASYVDRILQGAKPADLPVQGPTKFELVINLKTAKALGLSVPLTLLARADQIIE
jgi:putative ABC transport system substrate-binding protein